LHSKGSPIPEDNSVPMASPVPSSLYFGPATLSWTGQFPASPGPALVYRYYEPSKIQADQFATSLGAATPASPGTFNPSGHLGGYAGQGFTLSVSVSVSAPPREPRYFLTPTPAQVAGTD